MKETESQTFGGLVGEAPRVTVIFRVGRSFVNLIAFVLHAVSACLSWSNGKLQEVDQNLKQSGRVEHNPLVTFQRRIFAEVKLDVHLIAFHVEHFQGF